jgi:uncharacterized protein with ParB-like and HNH nuclease domain
MSEKIYKNARKVFSDSPRFVVPPYQREYSWQLSQIEQFLSDIDSIELIHKSKTNIEPKNHHFVGLLVFIDEVDEKNDQIYSVVDGQQRLSTLLLIAAVIKDVISVKLNDPSITKEISEKITKIRDFFDQYIHISSRPFGENTRKLEPNINDKNIYEILVLSDGDIESKKNRIQDQFGKAGLSRRYYKAYQYIYEYILDQITKTGEDFLVEFFVKYDQGISFIPFISESDTDAFNLFESLNDRGMSLCAMDLIKNKVLQKAKSNDLELFESQWSETIGADGVVRSEKAQSFMRYFLMLDKGHITNNEVYDVCKKLIDSNDSAQKFLTEIYKYGCNFRDITEIYTSHNSNIVIHVADDEIAEKLLLLNKTKVKQWQSLGLAAYSDFKNSKLTKKDFNRILSLLLKISVRFKLLNKRFNNLEKTIPALAQALHTEEIQSIKKSYSEVVEFCINQLEALIDKHVPNNELESLLDSGYLYEDNDLPFILLRMLAVENDAIAHGLTFSKTMKLTLEHVLPEKYHQHWGAVEGGDELKYSIGNMLLIELNENVKLSNKNFEYKKPIYASLNTLDLVTDENLKYQNANQETWINSFIKKREFDLVSRLKKLL